MTCLDRQTANPLLISLQKTNFSFGWTFVFRALFVSALNSISTSVVSQNQEALAFRIINLGCD